MQTSSMLGMAYHIKKLLYVKLGKKNNKNWDNYKNTKKEEEECVFWYYCWYKSSSCIYVCRDVMTSILQGVGDISLICTRN